MSVGADFPRLDESCRLADGRLAQAAIARWYDMRLRATHGILIALDMESLDQMRKVVEQTSGISGVVGYKMGLTVTLRLGLGGAVRHLRASTDLPLIYDHQKARPDVPDMAQKFSPTFNEAKVDAVVLFPLAGPRAVVALPAP